MIAALIAGLVESAYVSLLPVFALLRGLDEQHSLVLVTVFLAGNVILQLPIGRLGDRLGRQRVLRLCAVVCVIGPILLSAVFAIPWLSWPLLLLWGGTMYGFYTQGIALLGESYPHADRDLADAPVVLHRVPAQCHRSVGAEARQQQLPRRKAGIAIHSALMDS